MSDTEIKDIFPSLKEVTIADWIVSPPYVKVMTPSTSECGVPIRRDLDTEYMGGRPCEYTWIRWASISQGEKP